MTSLYKTCIFGVWLMSVPVYLHSTESAFIINFPTSLLALLLCIFHPLFHLLPAFPPAASLGFTTAKKVSISLYASISQ